MQQTSISDNTCDRHPERAAVSKLDWTQVHVYQDAELGEVTQHQLYCCDECSPSLNLKNLTGNG